jgi:hypothetical protein
MGRRAQQMTEKPFSPGGIIPSGGPGSDLVPIRLDPHEPVISFDRLRRWRAGELSLEDLLHQDTVGEHGEDPDGDDKS